MAFSMPIQWYHSHEDPIWPFGIPLNYISNKPIDYLGWGWRGSGLLGFGPRCWI